MTSFDPVRGSEQGGTRPAVIVSTNLSNERGPITTVVPITSAQKVRSFPQDVQLPTGIIGPQPGRVLCGQIRTVSKQRLGRRLGILPDRLMNQVDEALRLVLDL